MYMQLMIEEADKKGHRVTKELLKRHGESSKLFPGLADGSWFERVNDFGKDRGLDIKHYIVSSGIYEMIHGSPIAGHFANIYASKFYYENEVAKWPSVAINYTTKTQYLFRINKGIESTWDNDSLNKYMPEKERSIPFERMVFFGDGLTDIPTMKMLTYKGGSSIGIYENGTKGRDKVHSLISDGRVEFTAVADFTENSQLDITVKGIVGRIARSTGYKPA